MVKTIQLRKCLSKGHLQNVGHFLQAPRAFTNWPLVGLNGSGDKWFSHYCDVIMTTMASQITSLTTVYSAVYSGVDKIKHQNSASLAFAWGIHRGPVKSPHKWPLTRKMFPFDDVIMKLILEIGDWVSPVKLPSHECQSPLQMKSQHWFRQWLGTVRQRAITRTNVAQLYDAIWRH